MSPLLDPATRDLYRQAMIRLKDAGVPFLVGGAYAMERYTGISRHTKDLDIFVRPADAERVRLFADAGFRTERTHPHWLGKVYLSGEAFIDVIYRSGNAIAEVDDEWFTHAAAEDVFGIPSRLCPVEEILWSKSFVMERERFDGADLAHLIRACAESIDWSRLLDRFGRHWRVLLAHLILFGFIYPSERSKIPQELMETLFSRLRDEGAAPPSDERLCQGTLLSRSQYLVDIGQWDYRDARLAPRGRMSADDIARWTSAIAIDGSV